MHDLFDIYSCPPDDAVNTNTMPLIGDMAPQFTAETTNGPMNFPADYAGKWVILFSHPSDFTPVCTTEFMAFQEMRDEFQKLNTELVGLSVGTLTGHLAWLNAIRDIEYNGRRCMQITFPLIDDMDMKIAHKYGMIHPNAIGTKTVRAVFIIDPNGIIRTILYYPPSVGRNMDEIRRALIALQTTDTFGVSTPANWTPGEPVVVGAPATTAAMEQIMTRPNKSLDVRAWFLAFKNLGVDTIFEKLNSGGQPKKSKK